MSISVVIQYHQPPTPALVVMLEIHLKLNIDSKIQQFNMIVGIKGSLAEMLPNSCNMSVRWVMVPGG